MISYDLAKQLKEAGFIQKGDGHGLFPSGEVVNSTFVSDTILYVPTLSELIEACGDGFKYLGLMDDRKTWAAFSHEEHPRCFEGANYYIAVANLWLALNKK